MDYLVKAAIFVPFMAVVYIFVDYFMGMIKMEAIPELFLPIMCQFGILEGLSLFFTIIVSAFAAKQAISFAK